MTDLDRIRHMFGMSEERVFAILSIPDEEADLHTRVLQVRIWEILLRFGQRLFERSGVEIERERHLEMDRILREGWPSCQDTPKRENGVDG